jgi:transposase
MELLHHQLMPRDEDGQFVCSRCGLVNPRDDQPCIPINLEPTEPDLLA